MAGKALAGASGSSVFCIDPGSFYDIDVLVRLDVFEVMRHRNILWLGIDGDSGSLGSGGVACRTGFRIAR